MSHFSGLVVLTGKAKAFRQQIDQIYICPVNDLSIAVGSERQLGIYVFAP